MTFDTRYFVLASELSAHIKNTTPKYIYIYNNQLHIYGTVSNARCISFILTLESTF
jgi:hypothetical protein